MAPGDLGGDRGGTAAEKRVEHQVALVGVQLDETAGQFDGEWGRMAHSASRLGHLPHRVSTTEVVGADRRDADLVLRKSPLEKTKQYSWTSLTTGLDADLQRPRRSFQWLRARSAR